MWYKQKGKEREKQLHLLVGEPQRRTQVGAKWSPYKKTQRIKRSAAGEKSSPHLFPDEVSQTKHTTTATTHNEQASEYDQKQDHASNNRSDETNCIGIALDRPTGEFRRVPYSVNLRMR